MIRPERARELAAEILDEATGDAARDAEHEKVRADARRLIEIARKAREKRR